MLAVPSVLDAVDGGRELANSTVVSLADMIQETISTVQEEVDNANITGQIQVLVDLQTTLQNEASAPARLPALISHLRFVLHFTRFLWPPQIAVFNVSDYTRQVDEAVVGVDLSPLTTINSTLTSTRDTALSNTISGSDVQAVRDVQVFLAAATALLGTVHTDLLQYDLGYCSATIATTCAAAADCPGSESCVDVGVKRCKETPTVGCTADAPCVGSGTDRCLTDSDRLNAAAAAIQLVVPPSTDSVDSALTQINSATALDFAAYQVGCCRCGLGFASFSSLVSAPFYFSFLVS